MGSLSIQDQNDDVIRAKMKKKEAEKLEKEKAKTKEEDEEDSGTRWSCLSQISMPTVNHSHPKTLG